MDLPQEEWKNNFEKDENAFLLDVRTLDEYEEGHIPNASLLDILQPQAFLEEIQYLDASKNYYVYCRSGGRRRQARQLMNQLGIHNTYNLIGGFMEWH